MNKMDEDEKQIKWEEIKAEIENITWGEIKLKAELIDTTPPNAEWETSKSSGFYRVELIDESGERTLSLRFITLGPEESN